MIGNSTPIVEKITDSRSIATAQTLHLSPEKALDGTVSSKTRDSFNARHPGSIYHPLMVAVAINTVATPVVTLEFDSGDGSGFDYQIDSQAIAPSVNFDQIVFDLDGDFPGLLLFPKGERTAPDSLRIIINLVAATTASTTITFEVLES